MSARSKARKRALDMLYRSDLIGESLSDVLAAESEKAIKEPERENSWIYAKEIVSGVKNNLEIIDENIITNAHGWSIERMPYVDKAILRIAIWEIVYNEEVPNAVAIAEAVNLAQEISTEDSASFINGLLASVVVAHE